MNSRDAAAMFRGGARDDVLSICARILDWNPEFIAWDVFEYPTGEPGNRVEVHLSITGLLRRPLVVYATVGELRRALSRLGFEVKVRVRMKRCEPLPC